jgi:hypothetical protein
MFTVAFVNVTTGRAYFGALPLIVKAIFLSKLISVFSLPSTSNNSIISPS